MPLNKLSTLTNLTSLSIYNDLKSVNSTLSCALERMSSGLKLNQAKDDASGCVISSKLKTRINGTYQARDNLQRGVSLLNVAQGAYQNMSNILLRLRNISLSAMDDSYDNTSRQAFGYEAAELTNELERIRVSTKYNGISLFDNLNVVNEATISNLATPEATNFSMRANLIPKALSIEDDSGGDTFEYDSGGNNIANNNNSNKEVKETNLALSCLDEEENSIQTEQPMMMSMARSVTPIEETTIQVSSWDGVEVQIGNNLYKIRKGGSEIANVTYSQDETGKITFSTDNAIYLYSLNDEANNIVLKTRGIFLNLKSANDIVEVIGKSGFIFSEGGDNTIILNSGENTHLSLQGNGNDKLILNTKTLVDSYINFGGGNDTIEGDKSIQRSTLVSESGTVAIKNGGINDCNAFNLDGKDENFGTVDPDSISQIIVNGQTYTVGTNFWGDNVHYTYDSNTKKTIFIGGAIKVTANANEQQNVEVYGIHNTFYGSNKNDTIYVGKNSSSTNIYGQDGNDTIYSDENSHWGNAYGGKGDDTILASGAIGCYGEEGNDTLIANNVYKYTNVNMQGGEGDDTYIVNSNYTNITDSSEKNTYEINVDNYTLNAGGSSGKFIINGNNNTITGTNGDDTFKINGSNNNINAGGGDNYYIDNNSSNNIQNALDANKNGKLAFDFQNEEQSFTIDGKTYTITNKSSSTNTLYWNHNNGEVLITGSNFDIIANDEIEHKLAIDGNNNIIEGGNKNDIITIKNGENNYVLGNRGNDTINLDYKNNSADGGIGDDTININAESNLSINGNIGNDNINFNADNITNLQCGDGNDNIIGITSNSNIYLGNGDDNVNLIGNNNQIITNFGNHAIEIEGNENNINLKNADSSTIKIKGDENNFEGSKGTDELTIAGNKNIANGNNGNDNFRINEGDSNQIDGGIGRNVLYNQGTNTLAKNMINITPKPWDVDLQIGSEVDDMISTRLLFTIGDFELKFDTSENASKNIEKIDELLNQINEQMSDIGATLSRLDTIYELQNKEIENLLATNSIITDADMAQEAQQLTKAQILKEFSISLLSQSNLLNKNTTLQLIGAI